MFYVTNNSFQSVPLTSAHGLELPQLPQIPFSVSTKLSRKIPTPRSNFLVWVFTVAIRVNLSSSIASVKLKRESWILTWTTSTQVFKVLTLTSPSALSLLSVLRTSNLKKAVSQVPNPSQEQVPSVSVSNSSLIGIPTKMLMSSPLTKHGHSIEVLSKV